MNILQVNYCDLPGRIFNGYDLNMSLQDMGNIVNQIVLDQSGENSMTHKMCTEREFFVRGELIGKERKYGMFNLLEPFTGHITQTEIFKNADIVHYHIIHLYLISLLSLDELLKQKPSVWTLHDPWMFTGRCVHPLECEKWKTGCIDCNRWDDDAFPTKTDKAHDLWNIKKHVFEKIKDDVDIVVSTDWMMQLLKESPLTNGFKHIHRIPFGVEIEDYEKIDRIQACQALGISPDSIIIGFRAEENPLKGSQYIIEALDGLDSKETITIVTTGHMRLPENLQKKYKVVEMGWQQKDGMLKFFAATDIFIMTSLAESFGLMAVEAMAAKCTVLVFQGTALEKVTQAPECGIAVPYKSAEKLRKMIEWLIESPLERKCRGEKGYEIVKREYQYKDYVQKHMELYCEITERKVQKKERILYAESAYRRRQKEVGNYMDKLHGLRQQLLQRNQTNIESIGIYYETEEGQKVYDALKHRLIKVDYIVGIESNRLDVDAAIQRMETIENIPNKNKTLLILADKNCSHSLHSFSEAGIEHIMERDELDQLLSENPDIPEISQLQNIVDLDYSSEAVKKIVTLFNQTIEDVCNYYEAQIKKLE